MTLVIEPEGRERRRATGPALSPLPPIWKPLQRRRAIRREEAHWRHDQALAWRFQDICAGLNLVGSMTSIAAGTQPTYPHVIRVERRSPTALIVNTPAAHLAADYLEHAPRLAAAMGAVAIRIEQIRHGQLRVELLDHDPLMHDVELPPTPPLSVRDPLYLGRDEYGLGYWLTPADLVHLAVQGATGSGKSAFTYSLILQLLQIPEVLLAMSDPTGLLTRPFRGTVHEPWQVGSTDVEAHIDLLTRLVDLMDSRIQGLPDRRDKVKIDTGCQLIFAILEEYPGLLRKAAAIDNGKKSGGYVERIKTLIGRLTSEGRKAGIYVVMLAQRHEAIIVDSYARSQMTVKLSFRVEGPSTIEMLHPLARHAAEQHTTAPPGIALLTAPGIKSPSGANVVRIRTPYIGDNELNDEDDTAYGRYWDAVRARARRPVKALAA